MAEFGLLLEAANAVNSTVNNIRKVGEMAGSLDETVSRNGHKGMPADAGTAARSGPGKGSRANNANGANKNVANIRLVDADYSDTYGNNYLIHPSESKAIASYKRAAECMREIEGLQSAVAYRIKVEDSRFLLIVERAKEAASNATSKGLLSAFHGIVPEPTPQLEELVNSQIEAMARMQKHVKAAVGNSEAIVKELKEYDQSTNEEFDKARKTYLSLKKRIERTQGEIAQLAQTLAGMQKKDSEYVPQKMQLDDLQRAEKEGINQKEIAAQRLVYTEKQSGLVQRKEDVVRTGLHELRLVNDYVSSFLDFVRHTRAAEAVIPQLVQTASVVSKSYNILSAIFENGNEATTGSVRSLADLIRGVNYAVLPNAQAQIRKQKEILEKAERVTTFSAQAEKLLQTEGYAPSEQYANAAAPTPVKAQV